MYTLNDFFCGCGGIAVGFQDAGFKIVGAWDIDKYAVESYRANVGDHVKQADITEMTINEVPAADVWAFGFPCQDLSVAGLQSGMQVKCDTCGTVWQYSAEAATCPSCNGISFKSASRSGLFFEIMRLLDEAGSGVKRPRILMAENVKALRPLLPVLKAEYAKRGYKTYYALLNSKFWGVSQGRERYFVVGVDERIQGDFIFPIEQHDYIPKLSSALDTDVEERYFIPDDKARTVIDQALKKLDSLGDCHATLTPDRVERRQRGRRARGNEEAMFTLTSQDLHGVIVVIGSLGTIGTTSEHNNRVHDPEGISPTVTAVAGGTHHIKIFDYSRHRVRKLTPTEYGRLQGFPMEKWRQVVSNTQAYKQFGNAVTTTVAKAIATSIIGFLDTNLGGATDCKISTLYVEISRLSL